MNSKWRLTVLVALLIVIAACLFLQDTYRKNPIIEDNQQEELLPEKPAKTPEGYFPVAPNSVWKYTSDEATTEDYTVSIDFIKNNTIQLRYKGKKATTVKVYIQEQEGLYEVASVEDAFIKNDYTLLRQYKQMLLKLPIQVGNSWVLHDKGIRTITAVDDVLDTDLGEQKVVEVETRHDDYTTRQYFSEKIGLVGWYQENKDFTEQVSIKSYTTNEPLTIKINGYYVESETEKMDRHRQTIQVMTNEEPKHFLTDILKNMPNEKYIQSLPIDVDIQSIYVEEDEKTAYVDLSAAYNDDDYTRLEEKLAANSVAYTIGNYYKVKYVVITVNGGAYKGPIEVEAY